MNLWVVTVSKQTNGRSDTEREDIVYVYVWILQNNYKAAEH